MIFVFVLCCIRFNNIQFFLMSLFKIKINDFNLKLSSKFVRFVFKYWFSHKYLFLDKIEGNILMQHNFFTIYIIQEAQ